MRCAARARGVGRRKDCVVRNYGVRRSPLDLLAPAAMLHEVMLRVEERLAFARFI